MKTKRQKHVVLTQFIEDKKRFCNENKIKAFEMITIAIDENKTQ